MNLMLWLVIAIAAVLGPSWLFCGWVAKYTSPEYNFDHIPDLSGKVAIVTGANTGIGKVSARELAKKGAHVIVAARNEVKGLNAVADIKNEYSDARVEYMNLDLSSMKNVKAFCTDFIAKGLKIDILLLNAGIMLTPFQLTEDSIESQFGTNHIGHFLLVQNLLKVLLESKTRVVTVSSLAHTFPYKGGIDFDNISNKQTYDKVMAYGQSKLANILFANELSRRYGDSGISSFSLHPGLVTTELIRHVDAVFASMGRDSLLMKVYTITKDAAMDAIAMDVDTGAFTQLFVATSSKLNGRSGEYYMPIGVKADPSSYAQDEELAKKLWEFSMEMTREFRI